eukprot:jgi/Mesen1/6382/ME000329S05549
MSTMLAAGLSRKLKKVLETRTDSPELLASLSTLSAFYSDNSLQARRNLRKTIERRGLSINEEFLESSEAAQKALDAVEVEVQGLAECCDRIAKALSTCSATTGDMVVATERLKTELESTTKRQELVASFLHNYQLTQQEINALREEDLDESFFRALARVQEIHSNCKVLLRMHHQRAGLELMDVMAVYQEGAYERLCRWVQAECRSLGDSDNPEVSDLLKTASRSLRERPVLFKYCAEEVANTRHNALFRRFISALTRGGPGGMPRPMEVHAHDPLRYVGDMLAWLHQALASERELAMALFSADDVSESSREFSSRRLSAAAASTAEGQRAAAVEADMVSVLDRVFEGVCRPFRVLTAHPSLHLAYKLSNLLAFYSHTIIELLGTEAALSVTLVEILETAQRTFFDIMRARGDKLLRYPPAVAADLSPPPAVAETVGLLLELLDTHSRMMVPAAVPKPDFEPVMAALLDPLHQMCERAAEAYGTKKALPLPSLRRGGSAREDAATGGSMRRINSSMGSHATAGASSFSRQSSSSSVSASAEASASASPLGVEALRRLFLINCLAAVQHPLVGHEAASLRVAQLGDTIEAHMALLVDGEVDRILSRCELGSKVALVRLRQEESSSAEDAVPLAQLPEMAPEALAESLRSLFALLAGSQGALAEYELLQVPRLRTEACSRVSSALADAYATLYQVVLDPSSGYQAPRSMLRHTPDQMRTILGI